MSGLALPVGFVPSLVALDLDGTLLDQDGTVSARAAEAVARVRNLGVVVVAPTGRSLEQTIPVCREVGIDWAVCSNGALLALGDRVVETVTFDAGTLLPRIRELLPDAFYAVEDSSGVMHTDAPTMVWGISGGVANEPIELLMQEPAIRVVVRSDDYVDGGLRHVADELGLHSVVFGVGELAWLDIGPPGVNKATMLERLCERLGLASTHAVAVGDSMNDHEMLVWAGFGVAMGQADSATLALADAVTTAIPGDGVAEVLEAMEVTSLRVTLSASGSSGDVFADPASP